MTFAAPLSLLLLLLVPVGLWLVHAASARRHRHAVRLPALGTLAAVAGTDARRTVVRRWLPTGLLAATVVLLVVGMARPEVTVSVPRERASMMLVTDASRSMQATDVVPTRMDAAREAAQRFLNSVPATMRVGIIGYGSSVHTVQAPQLDRRPVQDALFGLAADGATHTGDALEAALDALEAEGDPAAGSDRGPGAILLLSDGMASSGQDPLGAADRARKLGIPIYTVALGTPDGTVDGGYGAGGVPLALPVPPDPETLAEIARRSGGQAFSVDDADRLGQVYEQVGARVGTEAEQRELTAGFGLAGLVLMAAAAFLGLRWRPRTG
ncbi:MAG: VWA domain-containing protein [Solirubrobacteraceae bacterium]|nr:VWA domain-containing protein [Solirubrobacteraceae bacterium]